MENDIIFKKASFGGFDREDVMNYISSITDEFHEKLAEKEKSLAAANEETTQLKEQLKSLQDENLSLNKRISELEKQREELNEKKQSEEEDETEQLKAAVKALTEKVNELISDPVQRKSISDDDSIGYDRDLFDLIEQYTD